MPIIKSSYRVSWLVEVLWLLASICRSRTYQFNVSSSRPLWASVLYEIQELAYVSIADGHITRAVKPLYNIYTSEYDRWSLTIGYLEQYAAAHPSLAAEYFLCLYDGWREYSEPVPPVNRTYVPWFTIPYDVRTSFYLGRGDRGEPRFRHNHPTRPDIYPELPLPVLAFNRHVGDRNAILLVDSLFLEHQQQRYVKIVSQTDQELPWEQRVARITWHGSRHVNTGYAYCLEGGIGEVLAPYNVTRIHQRILINVVANTDAFIDPDIRGLLDVSFDFLSIEDMLKYRYQLDIEGMGSSWGGNFWRLLSRESVTLFAPGHWEMWYFNLLQPYVHYIPLKTLHPRDILMAYSWCEEDQGRCKNIARASAEVIRSLTMEYAIKDYVLH